MTKTHVFLFACEMEENKFTVRCSVMYSPEARAADEAPQVRFSQWFHAAGAR